MFLPNSDWTLPGDLPNYEEARIIHIDTETYDPNLQDKGPGFIRGDAEVVGFSVSALNRDYDVHTTYIPIRHRNGTNFHNPLGAIEWLRDLTKLDTTKVFHNAMYDVEALDSLGCEVNGRWVCTMVNECLIDENLKSFSLDDTAERRTGERKDEDILREAAATFGVDPKAELAFLPPEYVGPYAEQDARVLAGILKSQQSILRNNNLLDIYYLESDLLQVVWQMRKQGVPVDVDQAIILKNKWNAELEVLLNEIPFDIWSSDSLADYCSAHGYGFNTTDKGNPSFENQWLENHTASIFNQTARARKLEKMVRDFLDGVIIGQSIRGRIHAQFHTTRRDGGGTRTGRFSSSNPNLQQIPARDPEFGPAIRNLFIPETGGEWCKFDYSSQEPRITLHFAAIENCRGVDRFLDEYRRDKHFDSHKLASKLVNIDRGPAKAIGLGITYGMEIYKLARELDVTLDEAKFYRQKYMDEIPYIKEIFDIYKEHMEQHGYVCTALGRRAHIDDPRFTYRALNRAVQGSGADMIKKSMVDVYRELGIVPLLTVHDESDYNIYDRDTVYEIVELMEDTLPLQVPALVEPEIGPTWGDLEKC